MRSVLVILAMLAACEPESERCDRGQRYSYGLCYELDAAVTADAAPDADTARFGQVCSDAAACSAPTDYCAKQPGEATGYCTRTGCVAAPELCPAGWSCKDLSIFGPGLPAICAKP